MAKATIWLNVLLVNDPKEKNNGGFFARYKRYGVYIYIRRVPA